MARGAPFPHDPAEFDSDERISYSRADEKYLLVDDDGEEWEFNPATGKWHQPATDEQIAAYQQAYGGNAEGEADFNREGSESASSGKKRKASASADAGSKKSKEPKVQENRAIYITNLPLDTTLQEIDDEFSKYGMIDQGVGGQKRIKMYTDEKGNFTGEALVVYFKKDSVAMAIQMMDDSWFRPGQGPNIQVKEADRSHKKVQNVDDVSKTLTRKDRKAHALNRAEMNQKLTEWSDEEDEAAKDTFARPTNKWGKIVIVKHAFTLQELEDDPNAAIEIAEDMREEGEEFGTVTNVVVYDKEPDGIVTVRFEDTEAATKFVEKCHGRFFDNRRLDVRPATENPKGKFKKSDRYVDEEEQEKHLNSLVQE